MRVVVIGAGVVGYNVGLMLSQEEHDVVIVERSPERIDYIRKRLDVMTIGGSGSDPAVLADAGVAKADLVVAATDADEVNMLACFTAKQMGAQRTVARLRKEEYIARRSSVTYTALGIDHIVAPDVITADEITDVLFSGAAIAAEDFGAGKIRMVEYKVAQSPITGTPLKAVEFPQPCKIVAIVRPEGTVIPRGEDSIRPGDRIYVVASRDDIPELEPIFGMAPAAPGAITIYGGGRIGFRLARTLERHRVNVKVIEQRPDRCELLAAELGSAKVICGDERDLDLFREEAATGADAFVGITARGELNILMALLAKQMGVPRAIAIFNEPDYVPLAERFGIDAAISPLLLSAGAILKFVRRGEVLSVALLEKQQAEAIELVAAPNSRIVRKPLRDIGFPEGAIVGAVLRNGRATVAHGNTQILPGDHVVVVTLPSAVPAVEKLFGA